VDADEDPNAAASSFRKARWFTRGWTLQELLAPPFIYFYGSDWRDIGSRNSLLASIVAITGIDAKYFTTGDLSKYSVAQKMSWAAGRRTTRIEDPAYSLLGLFGINSPLLYGEGERAFLRLQEEMLRLFSDNSILANARSGFLANSPLTLVGLVTSLFLNQRRFGMALSNHMMAEPQ